MNKWNAEVGENIRSAILLDLDFYQTLFKSVTAYMTQPTHVGLMTTNATKIHHLEKILFIKCKKPQIQSISVIFLIKEKLFEIFQWWP